MKFTAIVEQGESGWYVGQIDEVPAAMSQGETMEELRENLLDDLKLILDTWQTPYSIKFNLYITLHHVIPIPAKIQNHFQRQNMGWSKDQHLFA